jgi:hypothetical protein
MMWYKAFALLLVPSYNSLLPYVFVHPDTSLLEVVSVEVNDQLKV